MTCLCFVNDVFKLFKVDLSIVDALKYIDTTKIYTLTVCNGDVLLARSLNWGGAVASRNLSICPKRDKNLNAADAPHTLVTTRHVHQQQPRSSRHTSRIHLSRRRHQRHVGRAGMQRTVQPLRKIFRFALSPTGA